MLSFANVQSYKQNRMCRIQSYKESGMCQYTKLLTINKAMLQVLPHLLEEVRSEQLQQLVLPLVIHILGKQDKQVTHSVQHA